VERLIVSVALSAGTWGCGRIAADLAHRWQLRVAPSTVQRVLRPAGVATRRARLTVLEHQAAHTVGLLTERTRRRLWQARHGRTGSSSGCRAPFSRSTGGCGFGAATSPAVPRSREVWPSSCASITTSDLIRATASEANRPRRYSTAPRRRIANSTTRSGTAK